MKKLVRWDATKKHDWHKLVENILEEDWNIIEHSLIICLSLIDHRKLRNFFFEKLLIKIKETKNVNEYIGSIVNICYHFKRADDNCEKIFDYLIEKLENNNEDVCLDNLKENLLSMGHVNIHKIRKKAELWRDEDKLQTQVQDFFKFYEFTC